MSPVVSRLIWVHPLAALPRCCSAGERRGSNGLVDLGYGHFRVDHGKDEFVRKSVHINGIEGFWGMAKVRLSKFKGLPSHTFHLHLKETEWRYNHRKDNRYKLLLSYLRDKPLS